MLELLQSRTQPAALIPDRRGSAATAELYDENGTLKATMSAALDAVNTTVTEVGATPDLLTLASVTGIVVGRDYWFAGVGKVRVGKIAGSVVTLETPPAKAPEVGDTFQGMRLVVSVPSTALVTRGRVRIEWTITVGDEVDAVQQGGFCLKTRFRDPASADDAKRIAFENFASWASTQKLVLWQRIADEAIRRVREELVSAEDYPHLIADSDAFRRAGEIGVRIALAERGRVPSGFVASEYIADQVAYLETAVRKAVSGNVVNRADDGVVGPDDVRGYSSTRIVVG